MNGNKWNGTGYDKKGKIIYELKKGVGNVKEYKYYPGYDRLIFEGEYSNGKRNGKGKEYNEDWHLIFEGEYLNGKKWNGQGDEDDDALYYDIKNGTGYIQLYRPDWINDEDILLEEHYLEGELNGMITKAEYFGKKVIEEYIKGELKICYSNPILYSKKEYI